MQCGLQHNLPLTPIHMKVTPIIDQYELFSYISPENLLAEFGGSIRFVLLRGRALVYHIA